MRDLAVKNHTGLRHLQPGGESVDEAVREWRRGAGVAAVSSAVASIVAALVVAGTTLSSVGLFALGIGVATGTMVGWLHTKLYQPSAQDRQLNDAVESLKRG